MLIKVIVFPSSQDDAVIEKGTDLYEVYVQAAPQNGHANRVAAHLLSKHFSARAVLVSGGTRSHKIFRIE